MSDDVAGARYKRVHLVGIGGIGMSGLARLLLAAGVRISGSDAVASDITAQLAKLGATVHIGHDAAHLGDADALAYSTAVAQDNPELVAARERGVDILHRSDLLDHALRGKRIVAIAGTHGKTTTTALMGHILLRAGLDPTILVGGIDMGLGSNAYAGSGEHAVIEACESDRSFLRYGRHDVLVTNIEPDHLDQYDGLDSIIRAFEDFVAPLPSDGRLVVCADCPRARQLGRGGVARRLTYGRDPEADMRLIEAHVSEEGTRFRIVSAEHGDLGEWRTLRVGEHHALNTTGAIALALDIGVGLDECREAVAQFKGTRRRFERVGEVGGVLVIDDYAHHPTELRATLSAARDAMDRRIVAVFQPHLFSRTKLLLDEFAVAFDQADVALITDIYASRERPTNDICAQDLVDRMHALGHCPQVEYTGDLDCTADRLEGLVGPGDLVLTLGAGDVCRVARLLIDKAEVAG